MTNAPLYVYGVVPRAERAAVTATGVDGSDVETVEHGEFAALTSRVRGDSLRAPREVRAHWTVLQQACEGATVLPVRFGTVLEDERAVREQVLEANAPHLDALLKRLAGCVQAIVKGRYVEDRLLREVVGASPALSQLAARIRGVSPAAGYYDRIQLGERISAAIAQRRAADTQQALELLEPGAHAARAEEATDALDAFNIALLVKRTRQREFDKRVSDLAEAVDGTIELRYVGPLPPYSFAEGELAAGGN